VSSIKPEHLLSYEDYKTAKQLGLDKMVQRVAYTLFIFNFHSLSNERTWLTLCTKRPLIIIKSLTSSLPASFPSKHGQ
jgi:hypothetical protein